MGTITIGSRDPDADAEKIDGRNKYRACQVDIVGPIVGLASWWRNTPITLTNQRMEQHDAMGVDFVSDAQEAAIQRIADLLRHPDELTNKLPMLIKKTAMERASVEAQLKTVMEGQLDTTQKGIDALAKSKQLTESIKTALIDMDRICGDSENNIKNYSFIQKVLREFAYILDIKSPSKLCYDQSLG